MPHDPTDHPPRCPCAARLRHTLPLLAVILTAALATSLMWTQQRPAAVAVELASAPAEPVAEQHSQHDEPDMTGASIGAYER